LLSSSLSWLSLPLQLPRLSPFRLQLLVKTTSTNALMTSKILVTLIPQLINDLQGGDITKVIQDLTNLINLIQVTITDRTSSEETLKLNGITPQCIQDITNALPLIEKTVTDIASGNVTAIFGDVVQLISTFQTIVKDCTAATFPEFKRNDVNQCLNDITQLVTLIPKFVNDLESGDFSKIVQDLTTLVNLIQLTVSDCESHKAYLRLHGITPQCIQDITNALPVVEKTINDIASGDITKVLQDVVQLVSVFKSIVTDCTASTQFPGVVVKSALRH